MFSKADYWEYFETILKKEQAMISTVETIMAGLNEPLLLKTLKAVQNDEIEHVRLARELFEYL